MRIEMTCLDTQSSTDQEINRPVDLRRGEWEPSKVDNEVLMTGVKWISEPAIDPLVVRSIELSSTGYFRSAVNADVVIRQLWTRRFSEKTSSFVKLKICPAYFSLKKRAYSDWMCKSVQPAFLITLRLISSLKQFLAGHLVLVISFSFCIIPLDRCASEVNPRPCHETCLPRLPVAENPRHSSKFFRNELALVRER